MRPLWYKVTTLIAKDFEESGEIVREELERVLAGTAFASSQRSREFLRYVVEETLAGRAEQIKERSIAMAVFARGAQYDPGEDSIVRVKAVEVRKRLAQHYAASPGSVVRIDLPQGGYVPRFVAAKPGPAAVPWRAIWVIAAVGVCAIAAAWLLLKPGGGALDELWAPMAGAKVPVLIGLPSPVVYGAQDPVTLPLTPEQINRADDYYVGTGAAFGAAQVAAMLTARGGRFLIKVGSDVSYEDLKRQPAVFLGAHSSAWAMEFSRKLRYQFLLEPDRNGVVDTQKRERRWMRPRVPFDIGIKEDYALVARIFDRGTGNPVLLVAGCGARGTHAASEFVSSEEAFSQFSKAAPEDWTKRNFEVVLQAEVHGAVPGKPRIVAWHVW